ncbi:uncharacterized protein LOC133923214 [Phragmites australis]|uniref:uncharacterized protein LOC133923214 n=1 Tax=Phragmites australis TaxID=29695 RepID=UPI002D79BE1A|nr:uncharacterized protein LOC133923214 [Phragmites australis]
MGQKNKGGAKGGGDVAALPTPSVKFNPKDMTDPFELLDMCVAALHDKLASPATREAAMASLVGALEGVVPLDETTDGRCLVIFAIRGASIKKAGTSSAPAATREARLAYRAVDLLAFTLRKGGATEIMDESFPMLSRALQVQASQNEEPMLIAAFDCLAAVTFAGALGTEEAERPLKAIWGVIFPEDFYSSLFSSSSSSLRSPKISTKTSPLVVAATVSAWTFLVTTVTDSQRKADRAAWNATIASLASLLEADDRAVRMATGEALAVCVELNLTQHLPRKDMEALQARVSDLAAEAGGKGAVKTLLPEQKDLFRQIAAFMERGERPKKSVRTSSDRRESIKVSTWAKLVQLNFLSRFLGNGFLSHIKGNKLFKESFTIGADDRKMLSIAKKKVESKTRQKSMKMNREMAWETKNIFLLPQGRAPDSTKPEQMLQLGWH